MRLAALALALSLPALPALAECRFTLHFDFGSAQIERADRLLLGRLNAAFPQGPFALSAHADGEGTEAQNLRVAQARARAVSAVLRGEGAAVVAGEYWHAVPSDVSAPLNRRVEVLTPACDRAAFPEARLVGSPGVIVEGGRIVLLPPLAILD